MPLLNRKSIEKSLQIRRLIEEYFDQAYKAGEFISLGMSVKDRGHGQDYFKIAGAHLERMQSLITKATEVDPRAKEVWSKMKEVFTATYELFLNAVQWTEFIYSPENDGSRRAQKKLNDFSDRNGYPGKSGDYLAKQLLRLLDVYYAIKLD